LPAGNDSEFVPEVLDVVIDRVEAMLTGLDEEVVERLVERACSTVGVLVSTGRSARAIRLLLIPTSLAPLAGLAIQALVPLPLHVLALAWGWFAGVFLYLGASALIPAAHAQSGSRWLPAATMSGVALVYLVSRR
jgi:hypothetical protein